MVPVDDLIGTPFVRGGRQPGVALDCLGLVLEVARRRGIPAVDPWDLLRSRWDAGDREIGDKHFPVGWDQTCSEPQANDLLVMLDPRANTETHLAFVDSPGWVIQSTEVAGVVRTPLARVSHLIRRVYRWRGAK
jgi:cell wall-associated NlpC family hydrolase